MRRVWLGALLLAGYCDAQVTIQSVLNGASFSGAVAPGTWVAIFGSNLATSTVSASTVPLPTQLGGVTVTFGGIASPLNFVSPGQINAILPFEVPIPAGLAGTVPVVVTSPAGVSTAFNLRLTREAPGLFTRSGNGLGPVIAFDGTFKPAAVAANSPIVLYATGLGPTSPAGSSAGGGISIPPFNTVQDNLSVFIGDTKASLGFAGLAPGLPGVYQLNVTPNGPISDRVYLQSGGWQSNVASLPVAAGSNVANVTGSIDGLYPATGANVANFGGVTLGPIGFSVMFMGAALNTSFDILPNAKPFLIVATSEAGSAAIKIDPVHSTYQASYTTPTAAQRAGDFSSAPFTIFDFYSCTSSGCYPFPANVIPASRTDPIQQKALTFAPLPNMIGSPDGVNGIWGASDTLPSAGHFSISSTSLSQLVNFGGFFQIARQGASPRTATFSLYVDGTLVATKSAPYTVY